MLFQPRNHLGLGLFHLKAIQKIGMSQLPGAGICLLANLKGVRILVLGHNDRPNGQAIGAGKVQIPLIMGGAAENCARAIVHQDKIGDIDRQLPALAKRVLGSQAGIEAFLLRFLKRLLAGAGLAAVLDKGGGLPVLSCDLLGERVISSDGAETGAKQGVRPGGINLQPVLSVDDVEIDGGALRAADPVLLHQAHLVGPALQVLQSGQQIIGKGGDAQEPLVQLAPFHRRAGAPAFPVDHLFIRQHCLIDRVPVDIAFTTIGQPGLVKGQKQFLFMPVIARVAGGELPVPVDC